MPQGFRRIAAVIVIHAALLGAVTAGQTEPSEPPNPAPVLSGCEYDYPPYCTVSKDGQADGFSVELLRAALKAMGREVSFKVGPWGELKEDLAQGRLQALPLVARTPEREAIYDFTTPYLTRHGTVVIREETTDIHSFADLKGKRVAVLNADASEEFVRRVKLEAHVTATPTYEQALRGLAEGEQDAVVIQRLLFSQLVKQYGIKNLVCVGPPLKDFVQSFCFGVREGDKGLLAVLNEGLAIVNTDGTFRRLYDKWFSPLTPIEISRRRIIVGGDSNYPPYEFLDRNGQPAGFSVDLTRAIAKQMGMEVDIRLDTWGETQQKLQAGEIDIIQRMSYSAARDQQFDFSQPYHRAQSVIVTRLDTPELGDLASLQGKSILLRSGDIMEGMAAKAGLAKQLVPVVSQEEALRQLSEGKGDCALVSSIAAFSSIRAYGWKNLRVGNVPAFVGEYGFAVRGGNSVILAEFSEGLAAIEHTGEYRRIREKWLTPYEESGLSWRRVFRYLLAIVVPLLVLLLGSVVWSRSLQRQVARKTAALRESESRFRDITFSLGDWVWETDVKGVYTYSSPKGVDLLGWSREEIIGKTPFDFMPPEEAARVAAIFAEIVANKGTLDSLENWNIGKNGERICLLTNGGPILDDAGNLKGYRGVDKDITERKRAEAAQKQAEDSLRTYSAMMRNISEGIFVIGVEDNLIKWTNERFARMFGYEPGELVGQHVDIVNAPTDKTSGERRIEIIEPLLRDGEWHGEIENIKKDGTHFWSWVNIAMFDHPEYGKVMVSVHTDITDRKQAEERLRQAEKMNAVGQLAGGVAHDFNNQLTGVLGYADMLVSRLEDPVLERYARNIKAAATRAADLTKQLLAFSRKGKYLSVPVDVHKIIGEVVMFLEHSLDKRIAIHQHLDASPHVVLGDPTQLQNAFLNLAVNARDAMPSGGTLRFSTAIVDLCADPADPELQAGRHLQIGVTDTGTGMSDETQKHLFEPFFTTKEQGKGTGLGLAAVHGAVKNHRGTIRAESQVGKGTTFFVCLPLLEKPDPAPSGEVVAAPVRGDARILVVDDEAIVRDLAVDMLHSLGYKVTPCESGEAAIGYYEKSWAHVDLVILDMVMPGMGGRDTFVAMCRINPKVKAILVSGHSLAGEAQQILDEGMLAFVQKPFDRAELSRHVAEALGEAG